MSHGHIPIDKKCDNQKNNDSDKRLQHNRDGPQNDPTDLEFAAAEDDGPHQELDYPVPSDQDKAIEEGASAVTNEDPNPTDADNSDKDGDKDSKKKKNRCAICRKKVGLTGFECRCGGLFCAVHRYSDKHNCPFDYREMGAQEIRRNNPVVVGEKIQKI